MMKIKCQKPNQGQHARPFFTLKWHRRDKATPLTVNFFTSAEAEAAHTAVIEYCVRHNVHACDLPRGAIAIIIEAAKQGKEAPAFVAAVRIASGAVVLCPPSKGSAH